MQKSQWKMNKNSITFYGQFVKDPWWTQLAEKLGNAEGCLPTQFRQLSPPSSTSSHVMFSVNVIIIVFFLQTVFVFFLFLGITKQRMLANLIKISKNRKNVWGNSLAEKIRLMLRSVVELKCNITLLIAKNEKLIYFLLQLFTLNPNPQRLYLENQTYF